ncbi:MAG: fructosamine kinase family protein [Gammaproteobacteria bacterium]|jgi:fructosamine-3-kinase
MQDWSRIAADIGAAAGLEVSADSVRPVTGGCINSAWRLVCADGHLFVKTNTSSALEMFEAEHDGLEELLAADALRVPRPLATGVTGGCAWIAMEWIETGRSRHGTARDLGLGLARQHRCLAEKFGWARDNTIGSTPQANGWFSEWVEFYSQRRIRYQLDLAARNSYPGRLLEAGERLLQCVGDFFSDYRPEPSLLHGDLWGGNWAADAEGRPFLFDPAVYYGDREADLAMTELFGGFDAEFYAAYRDAWPLDAGYRTRRDLYNLYHVLNHLNLFGSGYLGQSEALLGRLIAALRG